MDHDQHLAALSADALALATAAEQDLEAPVATCPGWTVARLVGHTGRIHRWAEAMVRSGASQRLDRSRMPDAPSGTDLLPWFRQGATALVSTLRSTEPGTPMWTFAGPRTAAFWFRRQAQETSVHRWDAEQAVGLPAPISTDLAADGIDELLDVFVRRARPDADGAGPGRLHLSATNTDRTWVLAVGYGEASAGGTASDLLLFLWGRIGSERLAVTGGGDLLRQWQEAVHL